MHATTNQLKSAGTYTSSFIRSQITVNGNADTIVKVARLAEAMSGAFLSPAQTMFILISSGLIIFTVIALAKGEKLNDRRAFAPILLLRYFTEMVGLLGMIMALTNVPLAIVGAVTQASPILVALGSVIFLKEIVGWRRWGSITAGFLGVLLVIQPGEQGLDYPIVWTLVALVAFCLRDLLT